MTYGATSKSTHTIKVHCVQSTVSLIEKIINNQIRNNSLKLPAKPEVALRLKKVLSSEISDIKTLSDIILTEPAMAAEVLRRATAIASQRNNKKVDTIADAIRVMGNFRLGIFAQGEASRKYFIAKSSMGNIFLKDAWNRTLEVASFASAIFDEISKASSTLNTPCFCQSLDEYKEMVILASIIHDLGTIPIFHAIEDLNVKANQYPLFTDYIVKRSPLMGSKILASWELPNIYIDAIKEARKPNPVKNNIINILKMAVIMTDNHPSMYPKLLKGYFKLGLLNNINSTTSSNIIKTKNKFIQEFG